MLLDVVVVLVWTVLAVVGAVRWDRRRYGVSDQRSLESARRARLALARVGGLTWVGERGPELTTPPDGPASGAHR